MSNEISKSNFSTEIGYSSISPESTGRGRERIRSILKSSLLTSLAVAGLVGVVASGSVLTKSVLDNLSSGIPITEFLQTVLPVVVGDFTENLPRIALAVGGTAVGVLAGVIPFYTVASFLIDPPMF